MRPKRARFISRRSAAPRALIRYDADDGQALSQIALSRDGALLAYVRGGEPNGKGEIPNPRSLGTPPRREIWLLSTTGTDAPQLLGQGFAPQFSPDGARLLWLTDRGVASAPVSRSGVDIAGFEILLPGPAYALRFSPDGRRIAYERSSHVEVCDLSTRAVWAVDKPPDAVDLDPTWSPDGRSLALRRLFGPQPNTDVGYAGEYLAPQPWAILEASATTRQVREIWRAADGLGSAYYDLDQDASDAGVDSGQLFWSIDNDIAFTWSAMVGGTYMPWRRAVAPRDCSPPARVRWRPPRCRWIAGRSSTAPTSATWKDVTLVQSHSTVGHPRS